jgi:hypothetical protein
VGGGGANNHDLFNFFHQHRPIARPPPLEPRSEVVGPVVRPRAASCWRDEIVEQLANEICKEPFEFILRGVLNCNFVPRTMVEASAVSKLPTLDPAATQAVRRIEKAPVSPREPSPTS